MTRPANSPRAVEHARGRVERPLAPLVDATHFTAAEWAALQSADAKLATQRRAPGLAKDATVLSEPERIACAKYLCLGHYGVWRPDFARMTDGEVAAAVARARPPAGLAHLGARR